MAIETACRSRTRRSGTTDGMTGADRESSAKQPSTTEFAQTEPTAAASVAAAAGTEMGARTGG